VEAAWKGSGGGSAGASGGGVVDESEQDSAMNWAQLIILGEWMLPEQGSNLARGVDQTWKLVVTLTGLFFCIVVGVMTVFVIKFRRRGPNDVTSKVEHNTPLEILWTAIPFVIVMVFFYVGFKGFLNYNTPPSNCVVIDVEAKQWDFTFTYPNGAQDGILYLLKDQPVRLNLHSVDVLHGFYLPNFGTQRNMIPGRQTYVWLIPTVLTPQVVKTNPVTHETELESEEGWPIFCTQYCGDGHSRMFTQVFVLTKEAYEKKMKELANPFMMTLANGKKEFVPYVQLGKKLYTEVGCASCHSVRPEDRDSTTGTGPPWAGLWKRDHEFAYANVPGYTLKATDADEKWDAYLNESILQPDAKLVRFMGRDYHGMSNYTSQLSGSVMNEEKRRAIIDYIKSLGNTGWKPSVNPKDDPELFDADHPKLVNAQGVGVPPESVAGMEMLKTRGLPPTTGSQPAAGSQPATGTQTGP
jgi:cytochrome c oxidase subunit II